MSVQRRTVCVKGERQVGTRITWTDEERVWLRERAKRQGVSMARLIRRGVARDAARDGDAPPTTLCTADDYSEGTCAR